MQQKNNTYQQSQFMYSLAQENISVQTKNEYELYKSRLPPVENPVHHERTPACIL